MVLHGYFLHIATTHAYIRFLDLSEQQIKDVTGKFPLTMLTKWDFREICYLDSIVVTTSGEVFLFGTTLKGQILKAVRASVSPRRILM